MMRFWQNIKSWWKILIKLDTLKQSLIFSILLWSLYLSISIRGFIDHFDYIYSSNPLINVYIFIFQLVFPLLYLFGLIHITSILYFKTKDKTLYWGINLLGLMLLWIILVLRFWILDLTILIFIYSISQFLKSNLKISSKLYSLLISFIILISIFNLSLYILESKGVLKSCWSWSNYKGEMRVCDCYGLEMSYTCGWEGGLMNLCLPSGGSSLCYGYPNYSPYGYEYGTSATYALNKTFAERITQLKIK